MKRWLLFGLTCTAMLFTTSGLTRSATAAHTYYVDGGGSGFDPPFLDHMNYQYGATPNIQHNNGVWSGPFKTIQAALNYKVNGDYIIEPGDTIRIKSGTYNETVTPKVSGTLNNRITFTKYLNDPNPVVIDAGSNTETGSSSSQFFGIFEISNKNYLTIDGLTITDSQPNSQWNRARRYGVKISGGTGVEVKNCVIKRTVSAGIRTSGSNGLNIHGNRLSNVCRSGNQEGISITAANGANIYRNEVKEDWAEGIDIKGGCKNVNVYENYVHSAKPKSEPFPVGSSSRYDPAGIYLDSAGGHQENIKVYNNVVAGRRQGLFIANEHTSGSQTNIHFYNNIVYDVEMNAFGVGQWKSLNGSMNGGDNVTVEHNFLFNKDESQFVVNINHDIAATTTMRNFVFRNNIIGSESPTDGIYTPKLFHIKNANLGGDGRVKSLQTHISIGGGYTAATAVGTVNYTSSGNGLTVDTVVVGGSAIGATVNNAGRGYQVGDVITVMGGNGQATFKVTELEPQVYPSPFTVKNNLFRIESGGFGNARAESSKGNVSGDNPQFGPIGFDNPGGTTWLGVFGEYVKDVSLSASSKGVDNGTTSQSTAPYDFLGYNRELSTDIGPYERQ